MKRLPYKIEIKGAENGVMVEVGCVLLVYHQSDFATLLNDLEAYLKNPDVAIKDIKRRENIDLCQETPKVMQGVPSVAR